ncbi:hypothetical protein SADUNF_Sadunf08G0132000 [Salix dunnii]|uniref:PGG domain-containing protein n=1 Tax=Salix dunnii TaxID=1413687 RepID=A0A835MUY2_9ROSI|nr:hypothetical protein SADUNF_Sadunf08G0132000 [Salix dunnii]
MESSLLRNQSSQTQLAVPTPDNEAGFPRLREAVGSNHSTGGIVRYGIQTDHITDVDPDLYQAAMDGKADMLRQKSDQFEIQATPIKNTGLHIASQFGMLGKSEKLLTGYGTGNWRFQVIREYGEYEAQHCLARYNLLDKVRFPTIPTSCHYCGRDSDFYRLRDTILRCGLRDLKPIDHHHMMAPLAGQHCTHQLSMFKICLLHADIRCSLKYKMHLPDDIPNLPYTTKENPNKKEKTSGEGDSILQRSRETHLIVAALIATVTFASGFTLPGGYNGDGKDKGMVVLTNKKKAAFRAFVASDIIAMVLAISAVFIHFMSAIHNAEEIQDFLDSTITMLAVGAMVVAFVTGLYAELADSSGLAIAMCYWLLILLLVLLPLKT